jgi:hypothetical protein
MQSAAQGSVPFANNWQWAFGNPTVAAICPSIVAWLTVWFGPDYMNATHPILGPLLVALVAFVITWFAAFLYGMLKTAPKLYYQEKDRADKEQNRADVLQRIIEPPVKDDFIGDINIADKLTPTTEPVQFIGTATRAESRLRIVVEYSYFAIGLGWARWSDRRQVELEETLLQAEKL